MMPKRKAMSKNASCNSRSTTMGDGRQKPARVGGGYAEPYNTRRRGSERMI